MSATIRFTRCILFSQPYEQEKKQAVSTIYFILEKNGEQVEDSADVTQVVGDDFAKGPVEVQPPERSASLLPLDRFREEAEKYYRDLVLSSVEGLRTSGAPAQFTENSIVDVQRTVEL
jgi:hypothetical protein